MEERMPEECVGFVPTYDATSYHLGGHLGTPENIKLSKAYVLFKRCLEDIF